MPDLPRNITRPVRRLYGRAAAKLLRGLADQAKRTLAAGVFGPDRFKAEQDFRSLVREVYEELVRKSPKAAQDVLDNAAAHGYRYALERLAADIPRPARPNVDRLIQQVLDQRLTQANTAVATQVPVVAHRAAQAAAGPGDDEEKAATVQRHLDRAADQGLVRIPDAHGRHWGLETYPAAAATGAAYTQMMGAITDTYTDAGVKIVKVTGDGSVHPVCIPWVDKLLAIEASFLTGNNEVDGTPVAGTVAEAMAAGLWHVNCKHGIEPWPRGGFPDIHVPDPGMTVGHVMGLVRKWRAREAVAITPPARRKARQRLAELLAIVQRERPSDGT